MLFHGCWDRPGHFLHNQIGYQVRRGEYKLPFRDTVLDGTFAPPFANEPEEQMALTYLHNWSILSMWDRTIDTRMGSNATFLMPGIHDKDFMWQTAEREYPGIVTRLKAYAAWKGAIA